MTKGKKKSKPTTSKATRRCGLCGKTNRLVRTECCGNWICDDEGDYVMFSFARNSCRRNHGHFTLCSFHHNEEHPGSWKDCAACRSAFETEIYVYYGTNEYNFEFLDNPPSFEPTHCGGCGVEISLSEDGYSEHDNKYWCERCTNEELRRRIAEHRRPNG